MTRRSAWWSGAAFCALVWTVAILAVAHAAESLLHLDRRINRAYTPARAPFADWVDPVGEADCKAFVVAKIRALVAMGHDPRDMTVLIVKRPGPYNHAVLMVDGVVLDSMTPWLQHPSDYSIVSRVPAGAVIKAADFYRSSAVSDAVRTLPGRGNPSFSPLVFSTACGTNRASG
jgi:hypothetical protein